MSLTNSQFYALSRTTYKATTLHGWTDKHPNISNLSVKLPEIVELPLVIVNGTFRCLDTLKEYELEDFLRYLCKYTTEKEKRSSLKKPVWWTDDLLPYSSDFVHGNKPIFANNKAFRMRQVVKNAYFYYSSKKLLDLSLEFSRMNILSFQYKICSDGSTVVINKTFGNVLVRIPSSNMEYDFDRQKVVKKKSVLSEVQLIEVITLDDEEPQKDPHVVNNVGTKEDVRIFKSNNCISKNPQVDRHISDLSDPVVVLSDSDEEVSVIKPLPLPRHSCWSGKFERKIIGRQSSPCRRKKLSLLEKLKNLQKSTSISFYPCINISDEDCSEEEEEDDCQIIEDENKETLTSKFPKIRSSENLTDNKNEENYFKHDVPDASILSKKEEFFYNIGLVNKENMEQIKSLIQNKQPVRKVRRLKLPQYYMPLEILPLLVTRGVISSVTRRVISSTQLEYETSLKLQCKKLRSQKRITRCHIPPEVNNMLKECHVVLTRLPQNILSKFEISDNKDTVFKELQYKATKKIN